MSTDADLTKEELIDKWWFALLCLVIMVVLVGLLWWYVPTELTAHLNGTDKKGQFGDTFGSVNALFTGLAFAGVVFTILLQMRELRLQRKDFLYQLNEMKLSRSEVETQNQLTRNQIDVHLEEVLTRAFELESLADRLEAERWSEHLGTFKERVDSIRAKANQIRFRATALQVHVMKTDPAPRTKLPPPSESC